jgi:hypothetical protein
MHQLACWYVLQIVTHQRLTFLQLMWREGDKLLLVGTSADMIIYLLIIPSNLGIKVQQSGSLRPRPYRYFRKPPMETKRAHFGNANLYYANIIDSFGSLSKLGYTYLQMDDMSKAEEAVIQSLEYEDHAMSHYIRFAINIELGKEQHGKVAIEVYPPDLDQVLVSACPS